MTESSTKIFSAVSLLRQLQSWMERESEYNFLPGVEAALAELTPPSEATPKHFDNARSIYRTMAMSKNGLSDLNVWKNDVRERLDANSELDSLRNQLWQIFS